MYRVYITETGSFRAEKVGTSHLTPDIANCFESDFWHTFQIELNRRLRDGSEKVLREVAPENERRKRDT